MNTGGGSSPTIKTKETLFALMFSYRLIDLCAYHAGVGRRRFVLVRKQPSLPTSVKLEHWRHIQDLSDLLTKAQKNISNLSFASTTTAPLFNVHTGLLKQLADIESKKIGMKVLQNVVVTAFTLAWLRSSPFAQTMQSMKRVIKDSDLQLPDSTDVILANDASLMQPDELERLRLLANKIKMKGLRQPLEVALMVTPLILLAPVTVSSGRYGQSNLLQIMEELGNERPKLLADLENKMWQMLFVISNGKMTAYDALSEFTKSISPSDLKAINDDETCRFWFRRGLQPEDVSAQHESGPSTSEGGDIDMIGTETHSPDIEMLPPSNQDSDGMERSPSPDEEERLPQKKVDSRQPSEEEDEEEENDEEEDDEEEDDEEEEVPQKKVDSRQISEEEERSSPPRKQRDSPQSEEEEDEEEQSPPPRKQHESRQPSEEEQTPRKKPRSREPTAEEEREEEEQWTPPPRKNRGSRKPTSEEESEVEQTPPPPQPSWRPLYPRNDKELPTPKGKMNKVERDTVRLLDVEDKKPVTFDVTAETQQRQQLSRVITVYDPQGTEVNFWPSLSDEKLLRTLHHLCTRAREGYVNGQPPHIHTKETSSFRILRECEYSALSVKDVQQLLRKQHLVITEQAQKYSKFNEESLRSVRNLTSIVKIRDQSNTANEGSSIRDGTLRQVLECTSSAHGRIVHTDRIPMVLASVGSHAFSSDTVAWNETLGEPLCTDDIILPVGDIRWGQCFTLGAMQTCMREVGGFGLFNDIIIGDQIWIVAHPVDEYKFSEIGLFANVLDIFDHNVNSKGLCTFEAIYLRAGTRLVLRPNTPYTIFAASHCITHGGNFFSTSTIQHTFYGIINNFFADLWIDSPQHRSSRRILRRMISFYHLALVKGEVERTSEAWQHVPHVNDVASLMDLLALSTLGIFMNVLDFDTYCLPGDRGWHEYTPEENTELGIGRSNAMSHQDRVACTLARGMSLSLQGWIEANFSISDGKNTVLDTRSFLISYLGRHLIGMLMYKAAFKFHPHLGTPNCIPDVFMSQCNQTFKYPSEIIAGCVQLRHEGFTPSRPILELLGYNISRLPQPINQPTSLSVHDLMKMGMENESDLSYYNEDFCSDNKEGDNDMVE